MKVKIGDDIYDSADAPLMVILNDQERKHISQMGSQTKYCAYNDESFDPKMTQDEIETAIVKFMRMPK